MNKCIFMGRLTRDPEIRYTQSEKPVAVINYTLAVDRRYKREGEPSADFINFVAYGAAAEFAEKYFKKEWKDQRETKRIEQRFITATHIAVGNVAATRTKTN